MKRTPWFNAAVKPARAGVYEWRCDWATDNRVRKATYHRTDGWSAPLEAVSPSHECCACQWRGLTAPAKERT